MSDRHQIMEDTDFWNQLEYDASRWLGSAEDRTLRQFFVDGFVPESVADTRYGLDVVGTAWVYGPRIQHPFRFVVSVPQKMLQRRRQTFMIVQLALDEEQHTLQIDVSSETQVA